MRTSLRSLLKNLDREAHAAATSPHNLRPQPTPAQREAGNYKKGHKRIGGLPLAIENPAGSRRRPEWPPMQAHYGYVKRTLGADGDQVDVFVRPGTPDDWAGTVYVVDQVDPSGEFDEVKAMLGWSDQRSATQAYLSHYTRGWKLGPVTAVSMADFADWCRSDATGWSFSLWPDMPEQKPSNPEPKPEVAAWSRKLASMVGKMDGTGGGWSAPTSATSGIAGYDLGGHRPRKPKKQRNTVRIDPNSVVVSM